MDFEGETTAEVKQYAKLLGLKVSGKRTDVITRINEHLTKEKIIEEIVEATLLKGKFVEDIKHGFWTKKTVEKITKQNERIENLLIQLEKVIH